MLVLRRLLYHLGPESIGVRPSEALCKRKTRGFASENVPSGLVQPDENPHRVLVFAS